MKVMSPVGDFPYAVDRIALESRRLVLHGRMGAWPSRVELEGRDLLVLGRIVLTAPFRALGARLRRRQAGAA